MKCNKLLILILFCFYANGYSQFLLSNGGRLDIRLYREYPGTVFAGIFVDFYAIGDNNQTPDDFGASSNIDESLFSWADDTTIRLSLQRRFIPNENDLVRLEITQYRVTNYALRFLINTNVNGFFNNYIYPILHDKYLNKYFVMNQSDNVYFYSAPSSIPASRDSRRFDIVFKIPCEFASTPGSVVLSKNAISTLDRDNITELVENRNNGALVLESREKALILPRVANTTVITNPVEGMIVFDLSVNDIKVYDGKRWYAFENCTD